MSKGHFVTRAGLIHIFLLPFQIRESGFISFSWHIPLSLLFFFFGGGNFYGEMVI